MSNYQEAVLEGGPKDGEQLVVNLDYGPSVTVVMPRERSARGEERFHYYQTRREKEGRRVYEWRH